MTSVKPPPPTNLVRKPPPPPKSPRVPILWVVIACGVLCALLLFAGIQMFQVRDGIVRIPGTSTPILPFHGSPGQKVLLVMGVDAPNKALRDRDENTFQGTRTDTMMLVRVNADSKRASIVSIPRDSKVYLPGGRHIDKINAAHAIGGPDMAVQTVQDSFGIPVDNFMVINFRGVRELVDAIGGIDIFIEKPMRYTDRTAKLFIDFEPGQHHLNGGQAEAFLRFRHDQLGDIGRIRRQQQFLMSVARKLREPAILFKIPELVKVAHQYIETDLGLSELVTLAFFAKDVKMNTIRTATLPGRPGGVRVSYWVIDPEAAQVVLDRLILDNPAPLYDRMVRNADTPFRVGLLYDPALPGLADEIATIEAKLVEKNFEVVCKGRQKRASTHIVEHTSRVTDEMTDAIRSTDTRLENARLIFAPVGTTFESNACSTGEDYTVILGAESNKR